MQLKKISMLLAAVAAIAGAVAPMSAEAAQKPTQKKVSTASPKPVKKCAAGYVLKIKATTTGTPPRHHDDPSRGVHEERAQDR